MKKFYVLSLVLWLLTGCVSSYTPQNTQTTRQNLPPDLQQLQDCMNGDRQACHQMFLDNKVACESSSSIIIDHNTFRHKNNGISCKMTAEAYENPKYANLYGLNIDTNSVEAFKISLRYRVKACYLGEMESCQGLENIKMNLEQMK